MCLRGDRLLKYIDLILGILICIYIIGVNATLGRIAFSEVIMMVGILLIIYHFIKVKLSTIDSLVVPIKIVKIVLVIGILVFITVQMFIMFFPKRDLSKSDYAIVLGAGLRGETISLTLKNRLDSAIEYTKSNKEVMIVVSGGQGPGESITEAEAMKRYLLKNGIGEDKIIMENKSTSTSENLIFSKEKIENHSGKTIGELNIKIITTDFHALRSNMLAKKYDYKSVSLYTSGTLRSIAPVMYTREFFALIKSIIFD